MGSCRTGCGACCDPVMMPYRKREIEALLPAQRDADMQFVLDHMHEIPRGAALAKCTEINQGGETWLMIAGVPTVATSWFYRCDFFNSDTKECEAYDQRPELCSAYPWYGLKPDPAKAIPGCCTYLPDVGETPVDPPRRDRPYRKPNPPPRGLVGFH